MKLIVRNLDGTLRTIADSALGRPVVPWFIPDFGSPWTWRKAIALRVNRLGKGISPEFASRYVDAATLLFLPDGAPDYMDGAAVCGAWVSLEGHEIPAEPLELLVEVSRAATVKTGDVMACVLADEPQEARSGERVKLQLFDKEVLNLKIK